MTVAQRQIIPRKVKMLGHRPVTKDTGHRVYKQTLSKDHFTDSKQINIIIMVLYNFISPSESKRMIFFFKSAQ